MTTMAVASSQQSFFLTNTPITSALRNPAKLKPRRQHKLLCKSASDRGTEPDRKSDDLKLAKFAIVTLAAGVLTFGSVHDSVAAKSGGRIGGQAFRSAPRSSGPRINNSRTNVYINPPVAPPLIGGYGYGPYYGGWGWSPFSFFAPGPSVAVGVGGGFDFFFAFLVLGAIATVVRRFTGGGRDDEDDY